MEECIAADKIIEAKQMVTGGEQDREER